jgi:hypothetical protein
MGPQAKRLFRLNLGALQPMSCEPICFVPWQRLPSQESKAGLARDCEKAHDPVMLDFTAGNGHFAD